VVNLHDLRSNYPRSMSRYKPSVWTVGRNLGASRNSGA